LALLSVLHINLYTDMHFQILSTDLQFAALTPPPPHTISLRFLGIILRVLRLEVSSMSGVWGQGRGHYRRKEANLTINVPLF
jgi:hypothetical protein